MGLVVVHPFLDASCPSSTRTFDTRWRTLLFVCFFGMVTSYLEASDPKSVPPRY